MVVARKRRHGTTYYARFADQNGKWQEERSGTSKRDAQALEAQRKREVREGTYVAISASDASNLEGYVARWLSSRRNKTASDDRQRLTDHVLPVLGKVRLRDLKAATCVQFARDLLAKGMNPKTAQNVWGALRTCLRDALLEELISFTPIMPRGVFPRSQQKIVAVYEGADVELLTCGDDDDRHMLRFATIAFFTGMRMGEICGLRWSDWEDRTDQLGSLLVERQYSGEGHDASTKTSRSRLVPVHPFLASRLRAWIGGHSMVGGSLPIVPRRSFARDHHSKSTAMKAWEDWCASHRVESLGVHRTRHTAITAMRRGGAPREIVERVTHNSSGSIVDRYTHDWTILAAAVAVIDYSCRGASRGALANLTGKVVEAPGIETGAQCGQSGTFIDLGGRNGKIDVPVFPQYSDRGDNSRCAPRKLISEPSDVDRDLAPLSRSQCHARGLRHSSTDDQTPVLLGRIQWPARARLDMGVAP